MTKKDCLDFEVSTMEILKNVLETHLAKLAKAALRYEIKDIRRSSEKAGYASEFCVEFYKEKSLVNVLEGFIFFEGKRVTNAGELRRWLAHEIEAVVAAA